MTFSASPSSVSSKAIKAESYYDCHWIRRDKRIGFGDPIGQITRREATILPRFFDCKVWKPENFHAHSTISLADHDYNRKYKNDQMQHVAQ
jgi:hypothetical protein